MLFLRYSQGSQNRFALRSTLLTQSFRPLLQPMDEHGQSGLLDQSQIPSALLFQAGLYAPS